ncbi:MAG: hypothetical protein LBB72_09610 [Spirochaetaceae bacterium]|jgi:hypothetical protein|nr:hypothetical protein [Spirochaetaceae bacterium]
MNNLSIAKYPGTSKNRSLLAVFLLFLLTLAACVPNLQSGTGPRLTDTPFEPALVIRAPVFSAPLWFELGSEGPAAISSPVEASPNPFVPWTQARHIAAFLPNAYGVLYAGINRWGILKVEARGKETALYYYNGGETWKNYPALSFFRYGERPAALLGRDRFFLENGSPAPEPALWAAVGTGGMEPVFLPALQSFPPSQGWETTAFFQGVDNAWYCRLIIPQQRSAFLTIENVSYPGQEISAEDFFLAQTEASFIPPPLLAWIMSETERLLDCSCVALVVSPEFSGKRYFRTGTSAGELEFFGYYRPPLPGMEGAAVLLLPSGWGIYCCSDGTARRDGRFRLPQPAVESIVYSGAALAGKNLLVVSWEEQADWNVGAAGFLLLKTDW